MLFFLFFGVVFLLVVCICVCFRGALCLLSWCGGWLCV
jgi:hypothetical protein